MIDAEGGMELISYPFRLGVLVPNRPTGGEKGKSLKDGRALGDMQDNQTWSYISEGYFQKERLKKCKYP